MIYGLYNSAAGMLVNEYRQSVLANNIANAETVGFKRDVATFAERLPESQAGFHDGPSDPGMAGLTGGIWLGRTFTDHSPAAKTQTGMWSDVSLDGPGFLAIQADGQRLYTRDGRMTMDADGRLVAASDGALILSRGGLPIQLNPYAETTAIDADGRISQDGAIVAELEVVDFADYGVLRKAGAARFTAPDSALIGSPALVRSGFLESSGVQPLGELVSMIEASRAYQLNARMVALQDETVGKLINTVLKQT